jgi:hypothetical protein
LTRRRRRSWHGRLLFYTIQNFRSSRCFVQLDRMNNNNNNSNWLQWVKWKFKWINSKLISRTRKRHVNNLVRDFPANLIMPHLPSSQIKQQKK